MAVTTVDLRRFAWKRRRPALAWCAVADGTPRRRILVVDDEEDIRETLPDVLRAMLDVPVEVETAHSAIEAKRLIENGRRYDLVLTDERMPGLLGSEFLAWVRTASPDTRCALMSAYLKGPGEDAARPTGSAFFAKPLDLDVVLPRLRELLR